MGTRTIQHTKSFWWDDADIFVVVRPQEGVTFCIPLFRTNEEEL
jgi:hypothetical protein